MKPAIRSLFGIAATLALMSSLLCTAQTVPANQPSPQNPVLTRQVQPSYGKLPLAFEANQGQTDPQVKFLAHGSGYTIFLTAGQMVLDLRPSAVLSNAAKSSAAPAASQKTTSAVIQINMVGANPNPKVAGEDLQAGNVNYFIGKDPKKWQTNVAIYKQVRYKDVYPGIDLVYYGNQSRVEHDFVIAPGADPSQVQLDVIGVDRLSIAANGDLSLHKGTDEVELQAPVIYQEFHGLRVPVTGQYTVRNSTRVSFALGPYDKTMPLVIDPVLVYGTFLGGLANDEAVGITVDSNGSAYVTGWTQSTNFPLAGQNGPPPGGQSAFVAKLDVSGSSLVYADYIGGSSQNSPTAMAMDSSNHVFITGSTYASDFPMVNAYQATMPGYISGFITEISADGSSLLYSTYLGGSNQDYPSSIGLDGTGNVFVAGTTYSQDFPVVNAYQSAASPNQQGYWGGYGFLTKIAPDGSAPVFSTYFAGSANVAENCYYGPCWPSPQSAITGVAVDGSGNAYVAGNTNTYDFPVTQGAYQTSNATTYDEQVGFVGEFTSSGNLAYSTYFAAVQNSYDFNLNAVAVDSNGSAYIVGYSYPGYNSIPLTTPNLCDPTQYGCSWGFITKFDPTGSTLVYSTYLAANVDVWPQSLLVDATGDAYVFSYSGGGDQTFLVDPIETYTGEQDLFLQELDPTGATQLFSTFLGGYGNDSPGGIALDSAGAIYLTGYTNSTDYPVTAAALQNTIGGNLRRLRDQDRYRGSSCRGHQPIPDSILDSSRGVGESAQHLAAAQHGQRAAHGLERHHHRRLFRRQYLRRHCSSRRHLYIFGELHANPARTPLRLHHDRGRRRRLAPLHQPGRQRRNRGRGPHACQPHLPKSPDQPDQPLTERNPHQQRQRDVGHQQHPGDWRLCPDRQLPIFAWYRLKLPIPGHLHSDRGWRA